MPFEKRGGFYYSDLWQDLEIVLKTYARKNNHELDQINQKKCENCDCDKFLIYSDEEEASCLLKCRDCDDISYIGDSEENIKSDISFYVCLCGGYSFQITSGLSLYKGIGGGRVYVGGHCPACGLLGNYVDWNTR